MRICLPDLDDRIVHGHALAVHDASFDDDLVAGHAGHRQIFGDEPGEADVQIRTDRLGRSRLKTHDGPYPGSFTSFSNGVSSRPRRMMSNL